MSAIKYKEIENFSFNPVFRVYISGSSESGKTHFAKCLLERNLFECQRVYYFHPDFHEDNPIDWKLNVPIVFSAEFPKEEDFLCMKENSCIIFDDLIDKAFNSKAVDYLYRVLSGKRRLHVILMSQRYYASGKYSVSIRNSSNYHVLMRNTNITMIRQIASSLGLKEEIQTALEATKEKEYPYIFIDRCNKARARKTEVYIDILSRCFTLIRGCMKFYLLSETDFNRHFKIKDFELAEYVDKKQEETRVKNSGREHQNTKKKTNWSKRKEFDRNFKKALYRYQINGKI